MTKKDKIKTRTKYNRSLQEAERIIIPDQFAYFLSELKVSKRKIKFCENIDWTNIISEFAKYYEVIYKKLEIPKKANIFFNLGYTQGRILLETIKPHLFNLFFLRLETAEKTDNKLLYKMNKEAVHSVRDFLKTIIDVLELLELGKIPNSERMKTIHYNLQKKLSKYTGKRLSKDKIKLYEIIFKKNENYIKEYGKGNFRLATKNVTKLLGKRLDNFYKSFEKFKKRNNIKTYQDFKNFIDFTNVDNLSPSAKTTFPRLNFTPVNQFLTGVRPIGTLKLKKNISGTIGNKKPDNKPKS